MITTGSETMDRMLGALTTIRLKPATSEAVVGQAIAEALRSAGIVFESEAQLGTRARIDFFCPIERDRGVPAWLGPGIGIECKKGRPPTAAVLEQIERYCRFERIRGLVLVVERGLLQAPMQICGKPVRCLALNRNWGVAL